jgi:hypothetical protein
VTDAVGSPIGRHGRRDPYVSVVRSVLPLAVVIEILRPGNVLRHVLARDRPVEFTIALERPAIETIRGAQCRRNDGHLVGAHEGHHFLVVDRNRLAAAAGFGLALNDSDYRGIAGFADVHPVLSGLIQQHGEIRRIDLVGLVFQQLAHVNEHRSGGHLHLRDVVIEIQEREAGAGAHADDGAADIQLSSRARRIRPKSVARCQRTIQLRANPVLGSRRLEGDGALDVAQPRNAPRRIVFVSERHAEHQKGKQYQGTEPGGTGRHHR